VEPLDGGEARPREFGVLEDCVGNSLHVLGSSEKDPKFLRWEQ